MREAVNPWDLLMGALIGMAVSMMALGLGGFVDQKVVIGGHVLGIISSVLVVIRLFSLPPFRVAKAGEDLTGNKNG